MTTPGQQQPSIPDHIWRQMSPAQQAQIWHQYHQTQAVIAAQQRSSRSTKTTLLWIFVYVPLILVGIWLLVVVSRSMFGVA